MNGKYDGRNRNFASLEEIRHEFVKQRLQVRETDVAVDGKPLYLREHRGMRYVRVAAINASRHDDPDRRTVLQHGANLHRGCVGAQQQARLEVERVVHGARRVILRDVQRREIVEVLFNFRARMHFESGLPKDVDHAAQRAGDRMQLARGQAAPRESHVDGLSREFGLDPCRLERGATHLYGPDQRLLGFVDGLAGRRPLVRRQRTEFARPERESAFPAKKFNAHPVELREVVRRVDRGFSLLEQLSDAAHRVPHSCRKFRTSRAPLWLRQRGRQTRHRHQPQDPREPCGPPRCPHASGH